MREQALYDDGLVRLDRDGLTIRRYYFPLATAKHIPYARIKGVHERQMGALSGKGRLWGISPPRPPSSRKCISCTDTPYRMLASMPRRAGGKPIIAGGAVADMVLILGTGAVVLLTLALLLILSLWLAPHGSRSDGHRR